MKNFLNINDLDKNLIYKIITGKKINGSLKNKKIGTIYEKPSTRTRLSFEKAIIDLKGSCININFSDLNFSRSESFADTFKTLGLYLDALIYRTDKHSKLEEATKYFDKPIINALSDTSHPCQALADFYTLHSLFGTLKLNICWSGDINNVLKSLIDICSLFPEINLHIFSHKILFNKLPGKLTKNIYTYSSIDYKILAKADAIMTDVFISMNDQKNQNKEKLLKKFQVNEKLMSHTKKKCFFMHCLPAYEGNEVSRETLRGPKSVIWKQAYNRYVAQKALLQILEI